MQNQLKKDKDAFQVELDVVRSQKERSKVELTSLKKELDIKNNIITEKEMVIRDLKERQNPQEISYNEVCLCFLMPYFSILGDNSLQSHPFPRKLIGCFSWGRHQASAKK